MHENPQHEISKMKSFSDFENSAQISEEKNPFEVKFAVQHCASIIHSRPSKLFEIFSPEKSEKSEQQIARINLKEKKSNRALTGLNKLRAKSGCVEKPKLAVRQKLLTDPELKKLIGQLTASKSKKLKKIEFRMNFSKSRENLEPPEKVDKFTETETSSRRFRIILAKFSPVVDVWSNFEDYKEDRSPSPSSSISVASQCPAWRKLQPRKALKDLRKRKIVDGVTSCLETTEPIVWRASQPIPKANKAPDAFADSKNCGRPFSPASKLDRMKKYDTRRKIIFNKKRQEEKLNLPGSRDEKNNLQLIKRDYEFLEKKNCDFNVYFVAPKIWSHENFLKHSKTFQPLCDKDFPKIIDVDNNCLVEIKRNYQLPVPKRFFEIPQLSGVKKFFTFFRTNRNFCRLSLYIYSYGMLALVLIFLKLTTCKNALFYDPRAL